MHLLRDWTDSNLDGGARLKIQQSPILFTSLFATNFMARFSENHKCDHDGGATP